MNNEWRPRLRAMAAAYVSAVLFEGFWIAGATFFSDGRDVAVNTAVLTWWCLFMSVLIFWRLPAIAVVASILNLVIRIFWAWPSSAGLATATVFFLRYLSDFVLIASAIVGTRFKGKTKQLQ